MHNSMSATMIYLYGSLVFCLFTISYYIYICNLLTLVAEKNCCAIENFRQHKTTKTIVFYDYPQSPICSVRSFLLIELAVLFAPSLSVLLAALFVISNNCSCLGHTISNVNMRYSKHICLSAFLLCRLFDCNRLL